MIPSNSGLLGERLADDISRDQLAVREIRLMTDILESKTCVIP